MTDEYSVLISVQFIIYSPFYQRPIPQPNDDLKNDLDIKYFPTFFCLT